MEFIKTEIEGVWIIQPKRYGDARGYFTETFRQDLFDAHIGHVHFVQDNESFSTRGVLRGLHFQRGEWSQAKLVRVSQGRVVDVAVDLRAASPTFGRHVMVELAVGQAHARHLTHSRVRLFRGGRVDTDTHTAALRASVQSGRFAG